MQIVYLLLYDKNSLMFAFFIKVLTGKELNLICSLVIRLNFPFHVFDLARLAASVVCFRQWDIVIL